MTMTASDDVALSCDARTRIAVPNNKRLATNEGPSLRTSAILTSALRGRRTPSWPGTRGLHTGILHMRRRRVAAITTSASHRVEAPSKAEPQCHVFLPVA